MFATVMQNEGICRPFLERMLGIGIEKIVYLEREKDLRIDPYSKGIRLDVHVKDTPLRTRYYQGMQDISFLDKGNVYLDLPETYILFVCLFDLFGKGLPVYTFENMCAEYEGLPLNDKCRKVFYNVNAWERENNPERRSLLKYFSDKKAEDDLTRCMQEQVVHTLNLREWRKEHMTIEQEIRLQARYAYDDGKAEGISLGISQGLSQGARVKAVETAKSAIAMGLSVEQIVKLTGLSEEEIDKLNDNGKQ